MTKARQKIRLTILLVFVVSILVTLPSRVVSFQWGQQSSLQGLRGVVPLIGTLVPQIEDTGLNGTILQQSCEEQLSSGGIPVLTREQWLMTPGMPILYIQVSLHTPQKVDLFSLYINVQLFEQVILERDPQTRGPGLIWAAVPFVGTTNARHLKRGIEREVKSQLEEFIRAYKAANPQR